MNARRLAALERRAAALLPPGVAVAAALPGDPASLDPAERMGIARAVPARQAEFAGGRAAARLAQLRLHGMAAPVPMGPDRAPVWPEGLAGSITHAEGLCLAAVARSGVLLGLDLEPDLPLPEEIRGEVLSGGEAGGLDGLQARCVFSAKESVFKALYSRVGHVFGFDAVRVVLTATGFSARLLADLGPFPAGLSLQGGCSAEDGLILTTLVVAENAGGFTPRRHCLSDQWRDNGDPRGIFLEQR